MSTHSPGAVRAAERMANLARFPPQMVDALANMIDAETACKELARSLRDIIDRDLTYIGGYVNHSQIPKMEIDKARQVLAKLEGRA